ncbi:MAG: enoyl-CoA hydratase/isomerase family protein [Halieaceae bacterium]|jgi:enoyl-CoA hydratase/carnithine racemase|nr:enoyl-CoA hydratase/isomerase family protein [Halieaceae bacterium]
MASEKHLLLRIEKGVGIVTFNRPERRNAISWELAEDCVELFRELRFRDDVHVVVLTGEGKGFCSGGDVEWLSGGGDRPIPGLSDKAVPRYQRKTPAGPFAEFSREIINLEKPVIAALHGATMGAGLAYALACDRRFADTTTRMAAIFIQRGFSPDCGITYFLPRVTSVSNALMMVETGKIFEAEQCLEMGLIDELVPEGQALEAALEYAQLLAAGPSVAVDLARRFIHKSLNSTLDEMLDYEAVAGTITLQTHDAAEGTSSFLEKRDPVFKGQ